MHRLVDGRRLRNGRVADPAGVNHAHKKRRDVVEHDGDDHLVLPARNFENARNHAPDTARERARKERQNDTGKAREPREVAGQKRRHRAHQELALAAEVEHAAFIREARAKGREHQGRCFCKCRADTGLRAERALEEELDRNEWVRAERRHDNTANEEGQKDRQQRHKACAKCFFQFFHTAPPLTCRSWQG